MKKLYLFAALATMLAACSENDLTQSSQTQENNEQAVLFGAYVNRGTTRAGQQGTMTTALLQTSTSDAAVSNGFGVFGYYTNNELYSQNSKPEFFYNQKVYYSSTWTYSPIKYWPNEFGSSAESQAEDRLTFFAYAPYVPVDVSTGIAQQTKNGSGATIDELETGIISLTRNTALGDPYVKYYASFDPEKCVDLCFGVAKENFKSSVDGLKNNVVAGTPYVDVKKPTLNDRIYFDFKHALAQLNVQIDADVDEMSHGIAGLDANTKIYVREVTFEGLADKGMLNLYSEAKSADYTPKWVDLSGINEIKSGKVTIYDGRRDGREGQENAKASNEKPSNLNPEIIQTESTTNKGVVGYELQNLFDGSSLNAPVLVIPTGDVMRVTIVYDVETVDNNLATFLSDGKRHGSVVENKITKEITLNGAPLKLAAGKSYIVKMHLGMTSVKFNAAVTTWSDYSTGDVDLPVNAPTYVAGVDGTINLPSAGALADQTFVLTGITGPATYALSAVDDVIEATPTGTVDGSNITVKYSTKENTTVNNRKQTIIITESGGGQTITNIEVKQPAGALGLSIDAVNATTGKDITIKAEASGIAVTDWAGFNYTVIRKRNGETKTFVKAAAAAAGKYVVAGVDATKATITFDNGDVFETGDEYSITVQAGDAIAETKTIVIGGISYAPSVKTLYKVVGSPNFTNVPDGPGNITYALTPGGGAIKDASFDTSTGEAELNTTASTTASVVTATTDASSSGNVYITDKSKSDTYKVYLTNVNVDGVYSVDKNGGACSIILGALPKSATVPATPPTTDDATMVTGLACAVAPTDGVTTVTCTVTANAGATRTATITINGCKFYITQASGL